MLYNFTEKLITGAGKPRAVDQGTWLFHQNDPVKSVYMVEDGLVELIRHHPNGTSIVLQRAGRKSFLAEASLYSDIYHCDAVVKLPSKIFSFQKATVFKRLEQDKDLSSAWAAHLAREVQSARSQIDILSRRTVADRLDGWLAWNGGDLPSKGQWKNIAVQIGVSPEALYREISKRRKG